MACIEKLTCLCYFILLLELVTHTQKANFLSHSYRKQQLKEEEGSLEKQGGEKISHSMGMSPEENTAQTPDVETP